MAQIDKDKPVIITGATGYVAGWIVKKLLDEGLTVHAPVRDPENTEKLKYLNEIAENAPGTIKFFKDEVLQRAELPLDCLFTNQANRLLCYACARCGNRKIFES